MRRILVSMILVFLGCGGAKKEVAPSSPEPVEPTAEEKPKIDPARAPEVKPPSDWEHHTATSEDGTVTVRFWLPKESDGMVLYDAGWTPEDNRYELVGELRGNPLRFWELKADADADFRSVLEVMIEDEGAEQLSDEKVGEWRHVEINAGDGAKSTLVRRGRVVCQGGRGAPEAVQTLVRVCELISIERK